MSHIVARDGGEYFEFDNSYIGKVELTYVIKADRIEDAERCLDSIADSLSRTGVIGMSTADANAKLTNTDSRKVNAA